MNKLIKFILIIIPIFFLVIFFYSGRKFNNDYFLPKVEIAQSDMSLPKNLKGWILGNLKWFPEEKMFEKIDGRATFYRQIGVDGLLAGDWIKNGKSWAMYLYKMTSARAAKQAFLSERAEKTSEIKIGAAAYFSDGALTIRAGNLYAQFIADNPEASAIAITGLAVEVVNKLLKEKVTKEEKNIFAFAEKFAVPKSENFIAEDAFGFTSLKNVETTLCVVNGITSRWIAIENGAGVFEDYKNELKKYGCEDFFETEDEAGGNMFGEWEVGGIVGKHFFGVREAENKNQLLLHWKNIKKKQNE